MTLTLLVTAFVALVTGAVTALAVVAPKTKTKVDDKVLAVLKQYGVPLAEYLAAKEK